MKNSSSRRALRRWAVPALLALGAFDNSALADAAAHPAPPPLAAPPAGRYQLDPSHASVELRVSHMGFSTYTTRFRRVTADLTFDPTKPTASEVVVSIDADSLDSVAWPAECLSIVRGPQMLDVAAYPTITFRSERVRMTGDMAMELTGTLTLRGVSRPVVLAATYNGGYGGIPGMDPHARIGFSAHGSFRRSEFGMGFGVPAPGTTMGVGDLIDVSIEAEFAGPPLNASPPAAAR